jgi:hypothetical protein
MTSQPDVGEQRTLDHAYDPKCPADRTAVMIASGPFGVYKCAKDLTDPE